MRHLTDEGWARIIEGFERDFPVKTEEKFWAWVSHKGSGFQLAGYLIVGMLGGDEEGFPGFNQIQRKASPVAMAWNLDDTRRAMIADFLIEPRAYMHG